MTQSKAAALFVRSRRESFRRAGITFDRQGVRIALAGLSAAQVAALKAEPQLIVEAIGEPAAAESAPAPEAAAEPAVGKKGKGK